MAIPVSGQSTYPLEYHFRGARSAMRPLFDKILARLERELDFELKIGKAYVGERGRPGSDLPNQLKVHFNRPE
jgi:hypothetical protein